MKVTFSSPQILGNKPYKAGTQEVAGHLVGNQKFKQLVKAGVIKIHAKDASAQAQQAQKDAQNKSKAEKARKLTKSIESARASGAESHEVAGVAKPALVQKMISNAAAQKAKQALKSAGAPEAPVVAANTAQPTVTKTASVGSSKAKS